jgi:predicted metal-dependent peptidase
MTAQVRIDQARWWSLTNQPFYGSLAMSLADVVDTSIKTACTDGQTIHWNPDFVETLSDPELRFVLLHETLHCAHQHLWRLPITPKGNEAGDHEINLTLTALPGIEMPEGGLADPQYENLSCEEILGRLPDEPEDDSSGSGGDGQPDADQQPGGGQPDASQPGDQPGGGKPDPCGSFTAPAVPAAGDASGSEPAVASPEQLRDDWEIRVHQAAQAAQAMGQGDIPGDMERNLERMRHQTVDWRREMSDFVRSAMSSRNDWSRAARRHAWQPVIYPRRRVDDFGTVIFARDTSGSVSDETCAQYSALISDCVSELGCEGLVIDCDTRIQAEYVIMDHEDCPLTAKGGGGTKFWPVFDRAEELIAQGQQIAGIIYLTDLAGQFPESSDIATLWMATSDREVPFGRTVRIENLDR